MRVPKTTVVIAAVAAVGMVASLPLVWDLYRISEAARQYRLEDAVQKEIETDTVHKPSVADVLNPKFMAKYGLNSQRYLNAQGYFSPSGNDWAKWPLETRTAAILMWKGASRVGWQTRISSFKLPGCQ